MLKKHYCVHYLIDVENGSMFASIGTQIKVERRNEWPTPKPTSKQTISFPKLMILLRLRRSRLRDCILILSLCRLLMGRRFISTAEKLLWPAPTTILG